MRRRTRADARLRVACVVRNFEEASAALAAARELGIELRLASPRGAVHQLGVAYFHALSTMLGVPLTIDCDEAPGFVLEAVRLGAGEILYRGPRDVRRRLDALARRAGARVRARLDRPRIEPRRGESPHIALERALSRWIGKR